MDSMEKFSKLQKDYIREENERKITIGSHQIEPPRYGEVILTFHDGQLRYIDRHTREKVE